MILIIVSNWQNLKDGFKKPELIIAKVTLTMNVLYYLMLLLLFIKKQKEYLTFLITLQGSNFTKMI